MFVIKINYHSKKTPVGILMRGRNTNIIIDLEDNTDQNLHILVENMGRLNFGGKTSMLDTKVNIL